MRRVERSYLPNSKVLIEDILDCFLLIRGEWVDFAYFRHEGVVEVDLVVIESERGNMVSCFLGEDLSKVGIF